MHYGTRSLAYALNLDVGNVTRVDIPNLIDGTTYYFAVTAYDAAGAESDPSMEFMHTVSPGVLMSLSARADVKAGEKVLIAGFTVGGSSRKVILVRAIGPTLGAYGVSNPLADPTLEIYGPGGSLITNDNWRDGDPDALLARGLAPADEREAAVAITLSPGAYTAVVRSANESTGVALVEVYDAGLP